MIISKNQIKMDLTKLEGIRDWLTPKIHWTLCRHCMTPEQPDKERFDLELDRHLSRSIWEIERRIPESTSAPDTQFNETIHHWIWCLQVHHWGSYTTKGHEQRLPPLWIYITLLWHDTTKLWNIWPRTHGHSPRPWDMVTLPPRIPFPHGDPLWPQESHILQNCPKIEQITSSIESIPIRIWFETCPHPWI